MQLPNSRKIALTLGEPAGIGPDISLQIMQEKWSIPIVTIGCPEVLAARAKLLNLPLKLHLVNESQLTQVLPSLGAGESYIYPVPMPVAVTPGQLNPANAAAVLSTLKIATQGCQQQWFAAMVTAPVHKANINAGGFAFSGHTEFLSELTHTNHVVMLLMADRLKVALVTTHLPLKQVSLAITSLRLEQTLKILHQSLQNLFEINYPRILVCGLNPHAGENGHLGSEEIEVIHPVVEKLIAQGMNLVGPLSADTIFTPEHLSGADAILAMYHDQGLPILKHIGFGRAVNVTLGLPILRTSVDHGTALTLAGTGLADSGSLRAAIHLAITLTSK